MSNKCIYCKSYLSDGSVVDICQKCGYNTWGEKMFDTIVSNMESRRKVGDLDQGGIGFEEKSGEDVLDSSSEILSEIEKSKDFGLNSGDDRF